MFGFGKGDMQVILENFNFSAGDIVKGKAVLNLKKPQKAKQVKVVLRADRIQRGKNNERKTIHKFEMALDSEKEYQPGNYEYPFEIQIPDPLPIPSLGGMVGNAVTALQALSGSSVKIEWYVDASLDVPGGRDVSKKVQINVKSKE